MIAPEVGELQEQLNPYLHVYSLLPTEDEHCRKDVLLVSMYIISPNFPLGVLFHEFLLRLKNDRHGPEVFVSYVQLPNGWQHYGDTRYRQKRGATQLPGFTWRD